jgi:hypothetical protein
MSSIEELNRAVSLSGASLDYVRCVKAKLAAGVLAREGYRNDALAMATPRDASPRLQALIKAAPNDIDEFKKQITQPLTQDGARQRLLNQFVQKAAVAIGGVDTGTWGSALAPFAESSAGFVQSLVPFSAFDRILSDGSFNRAPLRTRVVFASSAAIGSTVDERAPKPVSAMSFSSEYLIARKSISQVIITNELALSMSPASTTRLQAELGKSVALATDTEFLDIISSGTGVASNPSTGLGAEQFFDDLETALAAIETDQYSRLYLIVPPTIAKQLILLRDTAGPTTHLVFPQMTVTGGTIQGIRVVVTSAATNDGILLDASACTADSGAVTSEVSTKSDVVLQDNPTAGSHQLYSLWANNAQLVRSERFFGVVLTRATGVAVISGMVTT